ncbi:MAG: hypothetical protein IKT40_11995 [Bacilli bacterium]|nr:hypothetical protein [Bacilli bacterium]
MQGSKVFTVLVVGENPEQLMNKYDINLEVPRYIKYKYLDAEKMKNNSIKILNEIIKNPKKFNFSPFHVDYLKNKVKDINEMTTFEYYSSITNGLYYDENGDAWSNKNDKGKWLSYSIGKNISLPFQLKNGEESYQARIGDVDWGKMHMVNTELYDRVWELMVENAELKDETDRKIYENMKDKETYFKSFKNKDEYVAHNCSYWHYAFLSKDGWFDMDDGHKSIDWVVNYFDEFINKLDPNEKITIFECTVNRETREEDLT